MIVFIAGMQRSGSTYTFNIVRELLAHSGRVYSEASADVVGAMARSNGAEHIVLKDHAGDERLISLVQQDKVSAVCSVRRVEDAIASWIGTFGFDLETAIGHLRGWFQMYRLIQPHCLSVSYDLIENAPADAAERIAAHVLPGHDSNIVLQLAMKYSKANVLEVSTALSRDTEGVRDIGFSYYDETTFFHRNHVSSLERRVAEDQLSPTDLRRVQTEFAEEIKLLDAAMDAKA
jgi:hypothetical protein